MQIKLDNTCPNYIWHFAIIITFSTFRISYAIFYIWSFIKSTIWRFLIFMIRPIPFLYPKITIWSYIALRISIVPLCNVLFYIFLSNKDKEDYNLLVLCIILLRMIYSIFHHMLYLQKLKSNLQNCHNSFQYYQSRSHYKYDQNKSVMVYNNLLFIHIFYICIAHFPNQHK